MTEFRQDAGEGDFPPSVCEGLLALCFGATLIIGWGTAGETGHLVQGQPSRRRQGFADPLLGHCPAERGHADVDMAQLRIISSLQQKQHVPGLHAQAGGPRCSGREQDQPVLTHGSHLEMGCQLRLTLAGKYGLNAGQSIGLLEKSCERGVRTGDDFIDAGAWKVAFRRSNHK